jgi:chromosome segregation ATPase
VRELTSHHYRRKLVLFEKAQQEASALYDESLTREQDTTARLRSEEKDSAARRKDLWDFEKVLKDSQERLFGLKSQAARIESDIERETKRVEFFEEKKKRSRDGLNELLEDVRFI